ncbi:MAG: UDP-N-acetylmuramate dehydrogenase [Thermoguttaceae bacterium]|nr:UDP-N-acetylmuramate dehydrogenase [Thermoguttaceae bacterium]MDW8079558.1 UDP-N-acetylmuramate dehydrogenase [Thermoguttaceae bacterium]
MSSLWQGLERVVRPQEPLAMYTWFQLGGPAEFFAEPTSLEQLREIYRRAREAGLPFRVLGEGSNILVRDEGVSGVVVRLSEPEFCRTQIDGTTVWAGAGARLGRVVTTTVREGLGGLENLVAIPGTMGGAWKGNTGAHGGDIGQWTQSVTVLTESGDVEERDRSQLMFTYRRSNIDDPVILGGRLQLEPEDPRPLSRRLQTLWIIRKARQPMGHQCAGRIFRDPRGTTAAELIEQAGLRGARVGGAVVSERHANFIVAEPECTAADVLRLIDLIRTQVSQRLGIDLELSLEIW